MHKLASVSIRSKLIGGFAVCAAFVVILGVISISELGSLKRSSQSIADQSVQPLLLAHDAQTSYLNGAVAKMAVELYPSLASTDLATSNTDYVEVGTYLQSLAAMKLDATTRSAVQQVERSWQAFEPYLTLAHLSNAQLDAASSANTNLGAALAHLVSTLKTTSATVEHNADNTYSSALAIVVVVLVTALLAALAMGLLLSGRIAKPLRGTVKVLERVAGGDLTPRLKVDGSDEVAQMAAALNKTLDHLAGSVGSITDSADRLAGTAKQFANNSSTIATATRAAAKRAGEAAESVAAVTEGVGSVAASSTQMSSSIDEIARSAQEAAGIAASAVTVADQAVGTIRKLGESSEEIGNVVKLISTIARQTNLLALNAAIEAARAGEAGKGFAVVAGEVKDLASETAEATDEISRRVTAIQSDVADAVAAMGQISEIVDNISSSQTVIAGAVEEQSATTGQMGQTLQQVASGSTTAFQTLNGVVESTNAATQATAEQAEATDRLNSMAEDLRSAVAIFRVEAVTGSRA